MAAKPVPITPAVLRWAMRQSEVRPQDVASYCKVDVSDVKDWMSGEAAPGTTAFRRLATYLGRSTDFFFLPQPPPDGSAPSFRRPGGARKESRLTREETQAVRSARRLQSIVKGLRLRLEEPPPPVPHIARTSSPENAANAAREFLLWSVYDQLDAKSKSAATKALRSRLEEAGICVFHFPMGDTGHRGFSLYDPLASVIGANTNYNAEARSFTYAHELGHLLRRADSFCGLEADVGLERWCEEFAAAFLLPANVLEEYVDSTFNESISTLAQVKRVANHFKVSQSAAAIRLSKLELGASNLYGLIDRSVDFAKSGGGPASGGLTTPERRLLSWGRSYAGLLVTAENEGLIRHHDVLGYLDVTSSQFGHVKTLLSSDLSVEE